MKNPYKQLADRIRGELTDLDRMVERAMKSWKIAEKATKDQDIYLDSIALNLHGFYSGLERLFELTAKTVDGTVPKGITWHRDLLHQASKDLEGIRPAIIDPESSSSLDEFRRFRHLVRNVYSINLVPEKLTALMTELPSLWTRLKPELLAFSEFLDELAQNK